ncbi:hypothetical protein OEA41_005854 [Lepraria neglecta]|uniref:alpha-galactosidase n=1 Tax=Lepraria neglecta TaxID=209136 RepID=A0AAD9Z9C1_9LECA|nr:hypothetical protein OEA41_005854 [Lepraria neglecta]
MHRKVICYFSAGSYENWRPDTSKSTDLGKPLDGWPGEWWLQTNSANVRKIMLARLDQAVLKGCDGVNPDNIDAYDNNNGVSLTQADAVEPFIEQGKPVFHIEYPDNAPDVSAKDVSDTCGSAQASDFSTVLKDMDLDDWVIECP